MEDFEMAGKMTDKGSYRETKSYQNKGIKS